MTEDNHIENANSPATSLGGIGVLAVYNDLSTKLTEKEEEKKRITAKYNADIVQVDSEIELIEKTVKGLQLIYDVNSVVGPVNKKATPEVTDLVNTPPSVTLPIIAEIIVNKVPTLSAKEDEPKPGERGALRYAIIRAVTVKDDFLTNDEVFDYLTEHFPTHGFVKRNVISGLKDARQAKAVIGIAVDGPGRNSFLHGLPDFLDDGKSLSTLKDEYLDKLVQKLELNSLTLGDFFESEKREVSDIENPEKKLPSVDADGNGEVPEENEGHPSVNAAGTLNGSISQEGHPNLSFSPEIFHQ